MRVGHAALPGCHVDIPERVEKSIMTTVSGMITVDRFAFGEGGLNDSPVSVSFVADSPADCHLRRLCLSCHLGRPKLEPGPVDARSRGGGCSACHIRYGEQAKKELRQYKAAPKDAPHEDFPRFHPSLSVDVTGDHCFGCHSRSGRIATNYEGWHETRLSPEDVSGKSGYRILPGKRVFARRTEDVHCREGLECIDCHTSRDLMGDGTVYSHKEEQVHIRCEDCHFDEPPPVSVMRELDGESRKIVRLRNRENSDDFFVRMKKTGKSLTNVYLTEDGKGFMRQKNSDRVWELSPPNKVCTAGIKGHESLSCKILSHCLGSAVHSVPYGVHHGEERIRPSEGTEGGRSVEGEGRVCFCPILRSLVSE